MARTIRAVDTQPGQVVLSFGDGAQMVALDAPATVIEHYRPFNLPSMVALALDNGQVFHGQLGTPVNIP